ncbi:MAG: DUF1614 domain-containing protein [Clostridiales bacterium]
MWSLSWGVILLAAVMLIIFFGLGERVLDRMGLTNWQAILALILMAAGSFVDIPIWRGDINVTLNLGGAVIPLLLVIFLLVKAGTNKERGRAIFAAVVTGIVTSVLGGVMMTGELGERLAFLDPLYLYPLVAGIVGYLMGRSRRSAFIAAILGVMSLDIVHWVWLAWNDVPGTVYLGGAGAFDSIVFAGIFAVVLAEVVGETRERLQGGPSEEGRDPALLANLKKVGPEGEGNLEFGKRHRKDEHQEKPGDSGQEDKEEKRRWQGPAAPLTNEIAEEFMDNREGAAWQPIQSWEKPVNIIRNDSEKRTDIAWSYATPGSNNEEVVQKLSDEEKDKEGRG